MQEWTSETAASTKNKHSPHKSLKMLTKISSYDRLIDVRRSRCSSVFVFASVCVCVVWLTQVRGQPGRLVLHSAGWPRGGSMDGGGSGVWQRVRGRTERAPLLLWIDTETQSMAHKALRRTGPEPKQPHANSPRRAPTPSASLELISVHKRSRCSLIYQHTGRSSCENTLRWTKIAGMLCVSSYVLLV